MGGSTIVRVAFPRSLSTLSIRQMTGALVVSATLPLFLLIAIMLQQLFANTRAAARDSFMASATMLAALVDNEIESHRLVGGSLALSNVLTRDDLSNFRPLAERTAAMLAGATVILLDLKGSVLSSTQPDAYLPASLAVSIAGDAAVRAGRTKLFDSEAPDPKKAVAGYVATPHMREGSAAYVVVVTLNPLRFGKLLSQTFAGDPAVAVLDHDRRFVARIPDHERRFGTLAAKSWRAELAKAPAGFAETITLEGRPSYTAYATSRNGWIAGLSYPSTYVQSASRRIGETLMPLAVGAILLSGLLGIFLSRQLSSSLQLLSKYARQIGEERREALPPQQIAEVEEISRTLHVTSNVLATRRNELERAHAFTRNVLDNLNVFVGVMDLDGRLIEANLAPLHAAGLEPADVIGLKFWDCYWWTHSDAVRDQLIDAYNRALGGEAVRYDVEVRVADGGLMWIDFQLSPLRNEKGKITHLIPSGIDLTERRRKGAEIEALYRNAPVGLALIDREYRFLRINEALAEMNGLPSAEHIGKPVSAIIPKLWDSLEPKLRRVLEEGVLVEAEITGETPKAPGVRKVWHERYYPLFDHGKVVRAIGATVEDVSARKADEKQKEFLMRELTHRLKNQLTIVQAMAQLLRRSAIDLPTYVSSFTQRLRGLAVGIDLLVQSNWQGA